MGPVCRVATSCGLKLRILGFCYVGVEEFGPVFGEKGGLGIVRDNSKMGRVLLF